MNSTKIKLQYKNIMRGKAALIALWFILWQLLCVIKYKSYDIMITAYCVIDVEIGHVNSYFEYALQLKYIIPTQYEEIVIH